VRIRFRGRERDYPEIALQDLKEIAAELQDISVIEVAPEFEGRTLLMVLAPNDGSAAAKPASAEAKPESKPAEKREAAPKKSVAK
jgi:translation initiation factor IF-3